MKCGGNLNVDYVVYLQMQYQQADGSWHTYGCSNGDLCEATRPTSGYYVAGSEHSGTNTWNPGTNIDCDTIRFHAHVVFLYVNTANFNSLTIHIGGC